MMDNHQDSIEIEALIITKRIEMKETKVEMEMDLGVVAEVGAGEGEEVVLVTTETMIKREVVLATTETMIKGEVVLATEMIVKGEDLEIETTIKTHQIIGKMERMGSLATKRVKPWLKIWTIDL